MIAFYGRVVQPTAHRAKAAEKQKLQTLVERRRQLLDLINQENNRRQQTADQELLEYLRQSLETLRKQVKTIDERLAQCVQADTANTHKVEILKSVKGIGAVTISTMLAELPELGNSIADRSPSWSAWLRGTTIPGTARGSAEQRAGARIFVACSLWPCSSPHDSTPG